MSSTPAAAPIEIRLPEYASRDHRATAAIASGATRASEYQWRPPSPPHISIPPITDNVPTSLPQYVGDVDGENHEILKNITQGNYSVDSVDWKYSWRRQAQPVLAFLYLGPASTARDMEFLKRERITMLLVVRDTISAAQGLYNGKRVEAELGIKSEFINIKDNQDLIRTLPIAIERINQHLIEEFRKQGGVNKIQDHGPENPNTWGKVLVFCESGNERSPAVVAAYLMANYRIDLIKAIQYVQQHRFCVAFDDGLKHLLLSYQDILVAQRSIQHTSTPVFSVSGLNNMDQGRGVSCHSKRGRDEEEEDDDDMDVDGVDDSERFRGRSVFTPFLSST